MSLWRNWRKLVFLCASVRVQPENSLSMVPHYNIAPTRVDEIRELVPIVTGTHILGASLAMDFSTSDDPPASHNINYIQSWLQDSVAAQQKILNQIVDFFASDFKGMHSVFPLMITCAVRRCSFQLRTLSHGACHPYLATTDSVVKYSIPGVFPEVHTHYQINCATRKLSLPTEFGGLNVPSLVQDVEPAHYASFAAILANLITDYESESLGLLYGTIRHELHNIAASPLPWAVVQLRVLRHYVPYGWVFGC
jgi:hypothetical protein